MPKFPDVGESSTNSTPDIYKKLVCLLTLAFAQANQDLGYAEAAVKLQRDWRLGAEPEQLPFAKHIKGQALVSLVQKGLRYHHLSLTVDENGQQTKSLAPAMFFFGAGSAGAAESTETPKETLLKASDSVRGVSPASTIAPASKLKPRDGNSNAPEDSMPQVVKRGRKPAQSLSADRPSSTTRKVSGATEVDAVNGNIVQHNATSPSSVVENTVEDIVMTNGNHDDSRMDIDHDPELQAPDVVMEEQIEEPLPPLVPTLTNGVSVEVQVAPAKVSNLGPTSAILSLNPSQTISRALWRPTDTAALLAEGETFCEVWNLAGQDLQPTSVKPLPSSLFPPNHSTLVTAAAWDTGGSVLALATYSEQEGQIHLRDGQDLALIESLPASQRAITMLKWHPSGTQLIGVSPVEDTNGQKNGAGDSIILCWNFVSGGVAPPSTLSLPATVFDIDYSQAANSHNIYAAAENSVFQCNSSDDMTIEREWIHLGTNGKEIWSFVKGAELPTTGSIAVAAAGESGTLWLPHRDLYKENAHTGPVTGLEIRPRQHPMNGTYHMLEFATSSLDGTIRIWEVTDDSTDFICIQQLRFEPSASIMSLAYSPDGFCIAGASYSTMRIWNAQHKYNLMASWEGAEPDWKGSSIQDDDLASAGGRSSVNGDGGPGSADHTLAWHTDSKRLAFGLGSQVAIVNFQR